MVMMKISETGRNNNNDFFPQVMRKPIFKTKKNVVSNGAVDGEVSEGNIIQKLWSGDRRMPIFGYTFETI